MKRLDRALVAAVSAGALLASCTNSPASSPARTPAMESLIDAVGEVRPVEGRLSGGFRYAPFEASEIRLRTEQRRKLAKTESLLRQEDNENQSPQTLRQLGLLYLTWGQPTQAVSFLEKADSIDPRNPQILNDLACAYLAHGRQAGQPHAFVQALSVAEEAIQVQPPSVEARFTLAVALERLFLRNAARQAWERYLDLDSQSDWAIEASQRLNHLEEAVRSEGWSAALKRLRQAAAMNGADSLRQIVARFPRNCHEYVVGEVLPEWAELQRQGNYEQAGHRLRLAEDLGAELVHSSGDSMAHDSVVAILEALENGQVEPLANLMAGHLSFGQGLSLSRSNLQAESRIQFESALRALEAAGSPLAKRAQYQVALSDFQQLRHKQALGSFEKLSAATDAKRYPFLAGKLHRVMGFIERILGNLTPSLSHYLESLALFEGSSDSLNEAEVNSLLAEVYDYLGNSQRAWRHRYTALAQSSQNPGDPTIRHIFQGVAWAELKNGNPTIALQFQNEALQIVKQFGDDRSRANVLAWRVAIHARLGQTAQAFQDLEEAKELINGFEDPDLKRTFQADAMVVEAELKEGLDDPDVALKLLEEAARLYREMNLDENVGRLHLNRAQAFLSQGLIGEAEKELKQGIEWVISLRSSVAEPYFRALYLDRVRPVFDLMIRLQALKKGNQELALNYAEQSRARVLLDRLGRASADAQASFPQPLTSQQILGRIPEGAALVEYAVLGDRLAVWTLERNKLHFREVSVTEQDLRSLVSRFSSAIRAKLGEESLNKISGELNSALLEPLELDPARFSQIVFVPDKFLYGLPFAALRRRDSDRYLIHDFAIIVAPSATSYIIACERDRLLKSTGAANLLAFGNPVLQPQLFPQLATLSGAEEEVHRIAQLYSQAELFTGAEATKERFLSHARRFTSIHFAGHALINDSNPFRSLLLLSPTSTGNDSALLTAEELLGLDLRQTRLITLSACRTASGSLSNGEGASALVQAFLAAGIPTVAATLWEIDDKSVSSLMYQFHLNLTQGLDAASALRQAQIHFLEEPDFHHPVDWAGFRVHGGLDPD